MISSPSTQFPVPPHNFSSSPTITRASQRFLVLPHVFSTVATISRSIFVISRPFSLFLSQFLGIQVLIPDSVPSHLSRSLSAYSQCLLVLLDQEYYFADWKVAVYLALLRNWPHGGALNHSQTHCLDCCVAMLINQALSEFWVLPLPQKCRLIIRFGNECLEVLARINPGNGHAKWLSICINWQKMLLAKMWNWLDNSIHQLIDDADLAWILTVPFINVIFKPSALETSRDPSASRQDDLPIYIAPEFPIFNHLFDFETFLNKITNFATETAILASCHISITALLWWTGRKMMVAELSGIDHSSLAAITSRQV